MSSDRIRVFKRLETDHEFRERIRREAGYMSSYYTGDLLDDIAWNEYRMQRRIIEDQR